MSSQAQSISNSEENGVDIVELESDVATTEDIQSPPRPMFFHHIVLLLLCGGAIGASFVLGVSGSEQIATPGWNIQLPSMCQFRNVTGWDCPGCGLTRAFVSIAHGDFVAAWRYNPASLLVFAFVFLQIPYRATQIWRISRGQQPLYLGRPGNILVYMVVGIMFGQWLIKMAVQAFS